MQLPSSAPSPLSSLSCPRCDKGLIAVDEAGFRLHACEACGGAFADHVAAATMTSGAGKLGGDASRSLKCPVCGDVMRRVKFAQHASVMVDICARHGTWFDVDDIGLATVFVLAGGAEWGRGAKQDARAEVKRRGDALRAAAAGRPVAVLDGVPEVPDVGRAQWLSAAVIAAMFQWTRN